MLMRQPFAFLAAACLLTNSFLAADASAETVIKFNLAGVNTGPDVAYSGGLLTTVDDGSVGTSGQQSTDVGYQGFLSDIPSIPSGASLTLSGVTASGSASGNVGFISQMTTGGMFSLFDNTNTLLLSGNLGNGVITGSTSSDSGGFFSTSPVLYTGGSLLPRIEPNSGAISLSLLDVRTGGAVGMVVNGSGVLQNFTATANGQLGASAVPEPSVIGMAAIGALLVLRQRRRSAKKTAAV